MISNHALKKVRLSLSTWQLLLVSTRWQINLSPENKLLKQHNLGQFGCSSLVKKFGRNCLTYLINYQDSTKVWEIPQTLCVVGMTTYYGINFKNSKSVKIFQDMHCFQGPYLAQFRKLSFEAVPFLLTHPSKTTKKIRL